METTVLSMDLHNRTQIMIAFYLNEYNKVAKTAKKLSHSGHHILAGLKCKCHISFILLSLFIFCGLICLIKEIK